jgi:hypothetical protein
MGGRIRAVLRAGKHMQEFTVPAKGQRAKIQKQEKIGDEFGESWQKAKGERGSWRGIREGEAESALNGSYEGEVRRRHGCGGRA